MRMLNRAVTLQDLRVPPANRLEKLSGDRAVNTVFVLTIKGAFAFEWDTGDAQNVEIVDYH